MEVIDVKEVTTRKHHQCFACLQVFPAGTMMICTSVADGGTITTMYNCMACEKLIQDFPEYVENNDGQFEEACVLEACQEYGATNPKDLLTKLENV